MEVTELERSLADISGNTIFGPSASKFHVGGNLGKAQGVVSTVKFVLLRQGISVHRFQVLKLG